METLTPQLKVEYIYSINRPKVKGLMVVVKPTPEMIEEDMIGVAIDFETPDGRTLEAPIEKCFGYEGNYHLYFSNLTKLFRPIGFSDVGNVDVYDGPYNAA